MKKFYCLFIIALLTFSCSTMNRAEKYVNSGDYDQAFDLLIKKYQRGVSDKNFGKYLPVFQEAYLKMVEYEEERVERLRLDNNPSNYGEMYSILQRLDERQTKLKALLPIQYNGKTYKFPTKNYNSAIADLKKNYVSYLIAKGDELVDSSQKDNARLAYDYYKKVKALNSSYPNIEDRLNDAHYMGTDFVLIEFENRSNQLIPRDLQKELIAVDTYNLDNFWTQFHDEPHKDYTYNYLVQIGVEEILISPERQNVSVHNFEKDIVDGWEYLYQNGQQVVDSLGNPIKVDRHITVRGRLEEVVLEKKSHMDGSIQIINLDNDRKILQDRLDSDFAFIESFGRYEGDRRAIDADYRPLLNRNPVGFPSNEQMVYDMGEDFKKQLKRILRRAFG